MDMEPDPETMSFENQVNTACIKNEFDTVFKLIDEQDSHPSRTTIIRFSLHSGTTRVRFSPDSRIGFKGINCLHYAALHGNLQAVKTLVEQYGSNPMYTDCHDCTPLFYASYYGHLGVVQYLVTDHNCDIHGQESKFYYSTALHYALRIRHFTFDLCDAMNSFLNPPSDIDCVDSSHFEVAKFLVPRYRGILRKGKLACKLLHAACQYDTLEYIKYLVEEKRIHPEKKNPEGETAVHVTCRYGRIELLHYFIEEKHCDPTIRSGNGNTPFHEACLVGDLEVATYLISGNHYDLMCCNQEGELPFHIACKSTTPSLEIIQLVSTTCILDTRTTEGNTALHLACRCATLEVVDYLIKERKCDPSIKNSDNYLPVHYACKRSLEMVKSVTNTDCDLEAKTIRHVTPLHIASSAGLLRIVKHLIEEKGCNPHVKDKDGLSSLHYACGCKNKRSRRRSDELVSGTQTRLANLLNWIQGSGAETSDEHDPHVHVAEYLVEECQSDPMDGAPYYPSPVSFACKEGDLELIGALTSLSVNCLNENNDTPLHIACKYEQVHILRFLAMRDQCDQGIQNKQGELALHIACSRKSLEMVKLVSNCNVHCQTASGETPLHIACKLESIDIVIYLVHEKHCHPIAVPEVYVDLQIHVACKQEDLELVKALATEDNINVKSSRPSKEDAPLHTACREGTPEIVQHLVAVKNCDINLPNGHDETPLHIACGRPLFDIKPVSNCTHNSKDFDRNTPLHLACKSGNIEAVHYLVTRKFYDTSIPNRKKKLPVHYACKHSLEMVRLVGNCDIDSPDFKEQTPLHIACMCGNLQTVMYLIQDRNCNPNAEDKSGLSPFHYACGFHSRYQKIEMSLITLSTVSGDDKYTSSIEYSKDVTPNHIQVAKYLVSMCGCDPLLQHSPLQMACQKGNLELVMALVTTLNLNNVDSAGNMALHYACQNKNLEIIKFLVITCYCSQSIRNQAGELPLHIACRMQSLAMVKLVSSKCDVNTTTANGDTPLHVVCKYDSPDIVSYLLKEKQCDPTIQNNSGMLPFHIACSGRSLDFVRLVSDFALDYDSKTADGDTALLIAWRRQQHDTVRYLVDEKGCDPAIPYECGGILLHSACQRCDIDMVKALATTHALNAVDQDGNTPLHIACSTETVEFSIVSYLALEMGSDQSVKNNKSQLALHIVCSRFLPKGKEKLRLVKLVSGCDPNAKDSTGNTPLHLAGRTNSTGVAKYLVNECKCKLDIRNLRGELPLHTASGSLCLEIVKLVGSDDCLNLQRSDGYTPLHIACLKNHTPIVKYLVEDKHCDLSIQNNTGRIPLHYACLKNNNLEAVKAVSNCENLNVQDFCGNTPLHFACSIDEPEITVIHFLLEKKHCCADIQNCQGEVPLHLVCRLTRKNALAIVELVSKYTTKPNVKTVHEDSPLHIACRNSTPDVKLVQFLIRQLKCKLSIQNNNGELPLHIACKGESLEMVKLVSRCDVNAKTVQGNTALHIACKRGIPEIIEYLIETKHCDLIVQNNVGNTPLHLACKAKDASAIVKTFCKRRDCGQNIRNECGELPLHIACVGNSLGVVKMVSNCDVNAQTINGKDTPLHFACTKEGERFEAYDGVPENESSDSEGVKWMTVKSSKCKLRIPFSKHPKELFVEFLVNERQCNLTLLNNRQEMSVHIACRNQSLNVVKLVSEGDMDLNLQTQTGDTLLHEACRNEKHGAEIIEYLVDIKRCVQTTLNNENELPVHIVCRGKSLKAVKMVCECDIQLRTILGNTPLHEVCMSATSEHQTLIVSFLLMEKECDPNCQNDEGKTSLHYLCETNARAAVRCLLSSRKVDEQTLSLSDRSGQTPIMLATDAEVIKDLILHGADPTSLYESYQQFFEQYSSKEPPSTPLNILVLGNASTGKTTLIESLKQEGSIAGHQQRTYGHTAGIIPNEFESGLYGLVIMYDFAGQREYYASHEAVLHNIIRHSPPVFLLVINVSESEHHIKQTILYWLSFIENKCSKSLKSSPHLVIIGSHADVLQNQGRDAKRILSQVIQMLEYKVKTLRISVTLLGSVVMDCRDCQSLEIGDLRRFLQQSSSQLRETGIMNFIGHYFYVYLLDRFRGSPAITYSQIASAIDQTASRRRYDVNSRGLIPSKPEEVIKLLDELNHRGHIIFLRNLKQVQRSWVVLDKETLFGEINGTMFAPQGFDQHHPDLALSTGVVPLSKIAHSFPAYDPNMIASFLTHMEFCLEIYDSEVVELLTSSSRDITPLDPSDKFFFFPNLVSIEVAQSVWKENQYYGYKCGWMLQCSQSDQFFTPHFLQVLLLRLAFSFALAPEPHTVASQFPVVRRKCCVWKKGIQWANIDGIETVVELVEGGQAVVVMMRCLSHTRSESTTELTCTHLRSLIIRKVLDAKEEFCSKVSTREFFIVPEDLQYPPKPSICMTLLSISNITESVMRAGQCIVRSSGELVSAQELLCYEAYSSLGESVIGSIFDERNRDKDVTDKFLYEVADSIVHHSGRESIISCIMLFKRILLHVPSETMLQERISNAPDGVSHELVRIFQIWRDRAKFPTYHNFRRQLDTFSIFCGRNPLVSEYVSLVYIYPLFLSNV